MEKTISTEILGIVGNFMYLAPFYGGDNDHRFPITKEQKKDLLERGVTEYSSYDYIDAILYNMSYEEYLEMLASIDAHQDEMQEDEFYRQELLASKKDDELPF